MEHAEMRGYDEIEVKIYATNLTTQMYNDNV
jgi:hypothetical protein